MDKKTQKHLLNILREGTITWHLRSETIKKFRKRVNTRISKSGEQLQRWEVECCHCHKLFKQDEIEVDHIIEVGPFNGNWDDYIKRLYCNIENLQILCVACHLKKTKKYMMERIYTRRKTNGLE